MEGWKQGSVRTPEMCDGWSRYKISMGADLLKIALETEDHVPKALLIDQIKSWLIRDDVHMTAQPSSKGHFLTPALMEIWQTRAEGLLQWHIKNGHENILFTDEKIFTIEEQYNNQNNKIYAQTSLVVSSECAGRPSHFLRHGMVSHQGVTTLHFCKKGVKLVPACIKTTCYKEMWNLLTWPSSMVRNGSSSRTQLLPTRPKRLRSGCGGNFWTSSAPRIDPQGVQTSTPWTVNYGQHVLNNKAYRNITTTWNAWRDPLWRQQQRSPVDSECGNSRVTRVSQGLRWGIGRPFWVTLL